MTPKPDSRLPWRKETSPTCDCGSKHCNGSMALNGIRFLCNGGSTLAAHVDDFPLYAQAPELQARVQSLTTAKDAALAILERIQAIHVSHTIAKDAFQTIRSISTALDEAIEVLKRS